MVAFLVPAALAALAAATHAGSQYFSGKAAERAGKKRAKETERETKANMIQDALQRSSELEAHRLSGRQKLGKRKSLSNLETAEIVRGALKI